MDDLARFLKVLKAFEKFAVEYVLVGGFAVALQGISRTTQDIDVFVRNDSQNIEKLQKALYAVFDDDQVFQITMEELSQYPVIRYGTPDDYYIDIMSRIGDAFRYEDLEFEIVESQGIKMRVATKETLITLKDDTLRPVDRADVLLLKEQLKGRKS